MGDITSFSRGRKRRHARRQAKSTRLRRMILLLPPMFVVTGTAVYFAMGNFPWKFIDWRQPEQAIVGASGNILEGRASVIDGDTVQIHGERVRFNGIDAPESAQQCRDGRGVSYPCGAKSAAALDDLMRRSSPTRCKFVERDRYGRFVGDCFRADGTSIQELMVRSGWAMDWPRYSNGAYAGFQEEAKADRSGIWVGEFQSPWEWRAARGATQRAPAQIMPFFDTSQSGKPCNIKGNISSGGDRIYHLPGQEHYTQTRILIGKGERWFCSEAEARAAGWRPARR